MLSLQGYMRTIFGIFLFVMFSSVANAVELKILTPGGHVAFTVPDEWRVLAMKTTPPVAVAAFQIPNQADEGTDESSNMVLNLYFTSTEEGRKKAKAAVKQYGLAAPKVEKFGEWTVYRQEPKDRPIPYTILDARRGNVADVDVGVRFAWPHLEKNPPDYDKRMEETLHGVLNSIHGGLGPYQPKPGEVIRRPEP